MHRKQDVYAIPSWVNGRAVLRLAAAFHEIRNPATGAVVRRAPLSGRADCGEALSAAGNCLPSWIALGAAARRRRLADLAEAVSGLAGHFSSLIGEETGQDAAQADAEVARVVALLRAPAASAAAGVAVVSGAAQPLSALTGHAAAALAAGAALLVFPALASPSAAFALAELSGQCGFPPGALNVLYAQDDVVAAVAAWSPACGGSVAP